MPISRVAYYKPHSWPYYTYWKHMSLFLFYGSQLFWVNCYIPKQSKHIFQLTLPTTVNHFTVKYWGFIPTTVTSFQYIQYCHPLHTICSKVIQPQKLINCMRQQINPTKYHYLESPISVRILHECHFYGELTLQTSSQISEQQKSIDNILI